ncbi:hypothetical protein INR49_026128 [Caranx melampygus]|nr:hypothetical protein INR49_026128 [Caranx melampygus]
MEGERQSQMYKRQRESKAVCLDVMAELPSGLLEACVVVGAPSDKLRDICQSKTNEHPVLEAEVLQVHAPPFVTKETNSSQTIGPAFSRVQRRKSFIKKLASEQKEDSYHFLVFTDLFGNRTHGVVLQCYRAVQLRTARQADFEETIKEFSAKLSLVPLPPPGQLHVTFSLRPLQVVLPSRDDHDSPVIDINLHLPFLCFTHTTLLQVLSCLLQEQRMVFFSSDWARLTLVAESLLLYLQPLSWQQPYVPVLARGMLDFLMAPTAFLMGCHISHFEEVAAETEDLILVNIDDGLILSSWSETIDLPAIPLAAAESFISRAECLQLHYDLELCHLGAGTDANAMRCQRREWQRQLNTQIQNIALELVVLETHIFHSFLRDRLNRKSDTFSRMEQNTRNNACRTGYSSYTSPDNRLSKRLGASLPNLEQHASDSMTTITCSRPASLRKMTPDTGLKSPQKPVKVFRLPEFPPPLAYHYIQNYYSDMVISLGKAINATPPDESALLARYHYLRGLVNTVSNRRLDALEDFQSLYKTDSEIFPSQMVKSLVDSLPEGERLQAERRPELKRLISRIKRDHERERHGNGHEEGAVKHFQLPKKYMQLEEFVKCVQESGIVKDQGTIHRLFDALTVGHQKQIGPDLFRVFYTIWKETEAEAQEVCLPASVSEHIEPSEHVFKLSSSVKTSRGVGKIAMTQRRLFLLTEGRPGYVEVAQYRDLEEVKVSSAPFLLLRIPSLKLRVRGRKEVFEANLKTETELWNLMVKEMWAGRNMADQHKDPQYMQQALTNALLMDAVVGSLQSSKAIYAASKLAHFDRIKMEGSQLWVSVSGGKVMVFDASSWSLTHTCHVGTARLNCMLGVDKDQVWMGSEDSVIYIISMVAMVCNRQLTEHRAEVTGLAVDTDKYSQKVAYSCSVEGTVMAWDVSTLQVRRHFRLSCDRLQSVNSWNGVLWCCSRDSIMEREELWSVCADSGEVWVGGVGRSSTKGKVYILDTERHQVLKELHGHNDKVTALCSAEDRYILSGAGKHDGKIAIWKKQRRTYATKAAAEPSDRPSERSADRHTEPAADTTRRGERGVRVKHRRPEGTDIKHFVAAASARGSGNGIHSISGCSLQRGGGGGGGGRGDGEGGGGIYSSFWRPVSKTTREEGLGGAGSPGQVRLQGLRLQPGPNNNVLNDIYEAFKAFWQ